MDLDKTYREFLSRIHREVLKPAGFKKEGGNFRICYDNGLCKIINFQRSMFNDGDECRFCINLGLYFQKDPPNPRFKEYECPVRQRAAILACGNDHWWCIFEGRDMEKLFEEVCWVLEASALPWLDRFESKEDVLRASANGTLNANVFQRLLWTK